MKNRLLAALRFAAAAVAGYAVIVVGTTLTLEGLLDGVSYRESSPGELWPRRPWAASSPGSSAATWRPGSAAGGP